MDVLVTDKTGTLTEWHTSFTSAFAIGADITEAEHFVLGLVSTEVDLAHGEVSIVGQNRLDAAVWEAPQTHDFSPGSDVRVDIIPFDHQHRMTSVLVVDPSGAQQIVTKGSVEDVMPLCLDVPPQALLRLNEQYDAGARVIAVASRQVVGMSAIVPAEEVRLTLAGFLVFVDKPKANVRESLIGLAELGITVKLATGDNARVTERNRVAEKVCRYLGLALAGTKSQNYQAYAAVGLGCGFSWRRRQ